MGETSQAAGSEDGESEQQESEQSSSSEQRRKKRDQKLAKKEFKRVREMEEKNRLKVLTTVSENHKTINTASMPSLYTDREFAEI